MLHLQDETKKHRKNHEKTQHFSKARSPFISDPSVVAVFFFVVPSSHSVGCLWDQPTAQVAPLQISVPHWSPQRGGCRVPIGSTWQVTSGWGKKQFGFLSKSALLVEAPNIQPRSAQDKGRTVSRDSGNKTVQKNWVTIDHFSSQQIFLCLCH